MNVFLIFEWEVMKKKSKNDWNVLFVCALIANWLSERRYFWDFVRPACIGSARQSSKYEIDDIGFIFILIYLVIERVEEVSKTKSIKDKVEILSWYLSVI